MKLTFTYSPYNAGLDKTLCGPKLAKELSLTRKLALTTILCNGTILFVTLHIMCVSSMSPEFRVGFIKSNFPLKEFVDHLMLDISRLSSISTVDEPKTATSTFWMAAIVAWLKVTVR